MATEHAVLGFLAIQPRHGYELAKEFTPETVIGDIVHLESGMLYAHLKKLEREGWVIAELKPQEARPARKVYSITEAGASELHRWMSEPVDKTRDIRLEFLLKLYLASQTKPELVDALIEEQRSVCDQFIASLEEQIEVEEDDFRRLVLEMRLAQNQTLVRWLARASNLDDIAAKAG